MVWSVIFAVALIGLGSLGLCFEYKFQPIRGKDVRWTKGYTLFYCDKGQKKEPEWHLFDGLYRESHDINRCRVRQLQGAKPGGGSYRNYAFLFPVKGENMKGLQHYYQFIVKCDEADDDEKGFVKVNGKKCNTRSYALIVRLAFGLSYTP